MSRNKHVPLPDPRLVLTALASLGDTPEAVAGKLLALGVKGMTCSLDDCPLARFLRRRFRNVRFSVGGGLVSWGREIKGMPPACRALARLFDRRKHPELEEEASA